MQSHTLFDHLFCAFSPCFILINLTGGIMEPWHRMIWRRSLKCLLPVESDSDMMEWEQKSKLKTHLGLRAKYKTEIETTIWQIWPFWLWYYKQHYLVPPPSPPTKYTVKTIREGISSLEHLPFRPQHRVPVLSFRLQLEKLTNPAIGLESHTEQLDIDKQKITRNRKIAWGYIKTVSERGASWATVGLQKKL